MKDAFFGAVQVRVTRPTNNLEAIVKFYKEGLGLKELGSFKDHDGYDGVMLGLPNAQYHLEFTQYKDKLPLPEPTKENLLILYFDTPQKYDDAVQQIEGVGAIALEPENPYWIGKSKTYEDPDKWRVVLFNGVYEPKL